MIIGKGAYLNGERIPVDGGQDPYDFAALAAACDDSVARDPSANSFVWVGLFDPTPEELAAAAEAFGIHPLAIEDALDAGERPKVEVVGDTLTVVVRPARYIDELEQIEVGQITMLASPRHVLVVRHGEAVSLTDLRSRMEADPPWLTQGPGAVIHAIVDVVVEGYAPVLLGVSNDISEVEETVFSDTRDSPTQRIYELKREVLGLYKAINPLVDTLNRLSTLDHPVLNDELHRYFSDTHDDVRRISDQVLVDRELLNGALEANLTQVSVRQNEDMRKISAWVAMAAVPTLIAGIYGMNFTEMPELENRYGYYIVLGVIVLIVLALYRIFKRSGWL